jgi:hypothetical protein
MKTVISIFIACLAVQAFARPYADEEVGAKQGERKLARKPIFFPTEDDKYPGNFKEIGLDQPNKAFIPQPGGGPAGGPPGGVKPGNKDLPGPLSQPEKKFPEGGEDFFNNQPNAQPGKPGSKSVLESFGQPKPFGEKPEEEFTGFGGNLFKIEHFLNIF